MRDVGVRRVVLVSSGAVYGEQSTQPLSEGLIPEPASPYAVSKLAAEYYVRTIGQLWGIETVALRVFNAYGPGQPLPAAHAPVVPQFLSEALSGASLVVHGDGTQTRDYIYVDDVVDALVAAATARDVNRRVINVGSGHETRVSDLIAEVQKVTGCQVNPIYNRREGGGVSRMCADITLAARTLGFKPRVPLAEGLRLMVERDKRFQAALKVR
jgi:UDP-glucose 4-epimerase